MSTIYYFFNYLSCVVFVCLFYFCFVRQKLSKSSKTKFIFGSFFPHFSSLTNLEDLSARKWFLSLISSFAYTIQLRKIRAYSWPKKEIIFKGEKAKVLLVVVWWHCPRKDNVNFRKLGQRELWTCQKLINQYSLIEHNSQCLDLLVIILFGNLKMVQVKVMF